MLPPPAIMTLLTGASMRLSSCMDLADVFGGGEAKYFVSGLHHRVALGQDRAVAAEYRGNARIHGRNVFPQVLQRVSEALQVRSSRTARRARSRCAPSKAVPLVGSTR